MEIQVGIFEGIWKKKTNLTLKLSQELYLKLTCIGGAKRVHMEGLEIKLGPRGKVQRLKEF